jgi:hypothetical protein
MFRTHSLTTQTRGLGFEGADGAADQCHDGECAGARPDDEQDADHHRQRAAERKQPLTPHLISEERP